MVKVTLRDEVREYEAGTTAYEIARSISAGLAKNACAARIDGEPCDLRTPIEKDCAVEILTFDDPYGKKAFWHTTSHVMAQAVLHLFPNAKFSIGPAIDSGFYYDFDVDHPFTADDLAHIEEEMAEIIKTGLEVRKFNMTVEEARGFMKEQPYKLELIEEHAGKGEALSFYQQGDFTELCAGPHLMSIAPIKAFKLTSTTGAYWRGSEKNKMLSRIYGISYPKKADLDEYLAAIEDAKRRDHNVLGRQLKYFCNSDLIGQGLPCLMPKGTKLFQILNRYIQDKEEYEYGYVMTRTPLMAKSDLYKVSGHWDHYKENMFVLGDEEKDKEVYALRPMTCPFQYQVYLNDKHSYRDLPIRYGETSTLFRNESSGEMHGLIRVRQFTITEGHLIVRPDQLEKEFAGCVKLIKEVMTDIGLINDMTFRFSRWDPDDREKYEGTPEMWEEAENTMRTILNDLHIPYVEAKGEAAFYGPKLDGQLKNVYGKEDTIVTVQIDMMLAQRFGMTYTDQNNQQITPYIIHRTSLGCYERTIALLIEKYAGALPLWLAPEQVRVMPITEDQNDYAEEIRKQLFKAGFRAASDLRFERIGFKIREAQTEKIPYMVVVGDKEKESGTVTVRDRRDGSQTSCTLEEFIAKIRVENDNKVCS
ncbi:MAG TPA: threonine--tRNA ligase [Oscillospiraceae bacterium]|nr:threonine--tRNA ligase [Oscillospiraceae bacterium]